MTKQTTPIDVYPSQLPLSCPLPGDALWNKHPKVFLPIEKNKRVICPYCSTEYRLHESEET